MNPKPNNHSIADVAYALLILSHQEAIVEKNAVIEFWPYVPLDADKSFASELLDPQNPEGATSDEIQIAKKLIQFKFEHLPEAQRTKAIKRFYEALRKADSPMHAMQKAIEQITAKPIKTLFSENWFSQTEDKIGK